MLGHGLAYESKFETIKSLVGFSSRTPPVLLDFPGTYLAALADEDAEKYFTNCRTQLNARRRAGEILNRAADLKLSHCIDFGGVLAASVFGGVVVYSADKSPVIAPVLASTDDIPSLAARIDSMSIEEAGLAPKLFEWRHQLKINEGFMTAFTLRLQGPVTVVKQICGAENFDLWMKTKPHKMFDLAGVVRRTTIRLVQCLKRRTGSPLPFLIIEEPEMAGLNADEYHEVFWRATRSIAMTLAFSPSFIAFRAPGTKGEILKYVGRLKPRLVQIGEDDPRAIAEYLPRSIVWGCVDPEFIRDSNPRQIKSTIQNRISDYRSSGVGFLLSANDSVADGTSLENISAITMLSKLKIGTGHSSE